MAVTRENRKEVSHSVLQANYIRCSFLKQELSIMVKKFTLWDTSCPAEQCNVSS